MPAKLVPYVVMMPEGWDNVLCKDYPFFDFEDCHPISMCPLANAKKAVDVQPGTIISLTTKDAGPGKLDLVHKVDGKPVTLYAVEMEEAK